MKKRSRALLAVGAVAASVATLSTPANAASGGGCSGYGGETWWDGMRACISAPSYGTGRPDAYIALSQGHPACTIHIVAFRWSDSAIMSRADYPCPSGPIYEWHYTAPDFYATSGGYSTAVSISGSAALIRSPELRLP
ncbi:hypothetical protein ACFV2Q_09750 [Streptomyces sp. NPDC059650]|uniref:hypothetical protein n=1 Tax=Streptomyces sp. NPDC059650 TaxID=3346896 RepID=UPI0036CD4F9A